MQCLYSPLEYFIHCFEPQYEKFTADRWRLHNIVNGQLGWFFPGVSHNINRDPLRNPENTLITRRYDDEPLGIFGWLGYPVIRPNSAGTGLIFTRVVPSKRGVRTNGRSNSHQPWVPQVDLWCIPFLWIPRANGSGDSDYSVCWRRDHLAVKAATYLIDLSWEYQETMWYILHWNTQRVSNLEET